MKAQFPFGVYDTKKRDFVHAGLYEDEAHCCRVFLGSDEIAEAKARGLQVLPLTVVNDDKA